jgi:hypothetical protein
MACAKLHQADLRGVDLSTALGLARDQLDHAMIDEETKLPSYLARADASADGDGEADDHP